MRAPPILKRKQTNLICFVFALPNGDLEWDLIGSGSFRTPKERREEYYTDEHKCKVDWALEPSHLTSGSMSIAYDVLFPSRFQLDMVLRKY